VSPSPPEVVGDPGLPKSEGRRRHLPDALFSDEGEKDLPPPSRPSGAAAWQGDRAPIPRILRAQAAQGGSRISNPRSQGIGQAASADSREERRHLKTNSNGRIRMAIAWCGARRASHLSPFLLRQLRLEIGPARYWCGAVLVSVSSVHQPKRMLGGDRNWLIIPPCSRDGGAPARVQNHPGSVGPDMGRPAGSMISKSCADGTR